MFDVGDEQSPYESTLHALAEIALGFFKLLIDDNHDSHRGPAVERVEQITDGAPMKRYPVALDDTQIEGVVDELSARLAAFHASGAVPPKKVCNVVAEILAGRGMQLVCARRVSTSATGERFIKVRLSGPILKALTALRAMQRGRFVYDRLSHENVPSLETTARRLKILS